MSMTREQANDIFTPENEEKFAEQIKQLDHGTLTEAYQALNDGSYPTEKEAKIRGALLEEAAERIKTLASGGFKDDELDGVSAFVAEFGNDEQKAAIGSLVEQRRSDMADIAYLNNIDEHNRGGQAFAAGILNDRAAPGDGSYNDMLINAVETMHFIEHNRHAMPEGILRDNIEPFVEKASDFVNVSEQEIANFAAKENEHGVLRYFDTFGRGDDGEYTPEALGFLSQVNAVREANGVEPLVLRDGTLSDREQMEDFLDSFDPQEPGVAEFKKYMTLQLDGAEFDDDGHPLHNPMIEDNLDERAVALQYLNSLEQYTAFGVPHLYSNNAEVPAVLDDLAEQFKEDSRVLLERELDDMDNELLGAVVSGDANQNPEVIALMDKINTFGRDKEGEYTGEVAEWLERTNETRANMGLDPLEETDLSQPYVAPVRENTDNVIDDESDEVDTPDLTSTGDENDVDVDTSEEIDTDTGEVLDAERENYMADLAADGSRQALAFKNMVEENVSADLTAGEVLQYGVDVKTWIDQDFSNMPVSIQNQASDFIDQVEKSIDNLAPEIIKEAAQDANEEVVVAFSNAFGPKGQEFLDKVNAERVAGGAKPFSVEHAAEQKYLRELPEDNKEAQAFKDMVQNVSALSETDVEFLQRHIDVKKWIDEDHDNMPAGIQAQADSHVSSVEKMIENHPLTPEQLAEYAKDENQEVVQAFVEAYGDAAKPWATQIHDERVKEGLEDSEERKEIVEYLAKIDDNQKDNNEAEDEALRNTDLGARAYKDYVMAQLDAAESGTEVDLSEVNLVAAYHYMAHRKPEDKEDMPAMVREFERKFEEEAKNAIKDKTLSSEYALSDNIYETKKFMDFMAQYDPDKSVDENGKVKFGADAQDILIDIESRRSMQDQIRFSESVFLAETSSEELKKRDEAINNLLESDDMKNMLESEEFKNLNTFYEHVEVEGMEDLPQARDKGALRVEKVTGLFGGKDKEGEEGEEKPEEEKKKRIQRGSDLKKDIYDLARAQAARELMQDSSFFEADEAERKRLMKLAVAEKMEAATLTMLANQYAQGVLGEGAYGNTSAQERKDYIYKLANGKYVGQYAVQAGAMFGGIVGDPEAGTIRLSERAVATSLAVDVASVEKFAETLKQKIGENKLVQRVKAIDKRFTEKYPTLYPMAKKMATRFAIGQLTGPVGIAVYTAKETVKASKKLWDRYRQQKETGGEQSLGKYLLHHKCEVLGVAASAVGAGIAAWTGIDAINSDSIEAGLGAVGHWASNIMGHGADQAASAASNLAEGASLVDKIKDLPANTWESVSNISTHAWEGIKNAGSAIGTMASDVAHGNFSEIIEHAHNLTGKQVASLARASMGFAAGFGAASESFAKGNWKQGWKQFAGAFAGATAAAIALEMQSGHSMDAQVQETPSPAPEPTPAPTPTPTPETTDEYETGGGLNNFQLGTNIDLHDPKIDELSQRISNLDNDVRIHYGQYGHHDGGAGGDGLGGNGGQDGDGGQSGGDEQLQGDQQQQQQQQQEQHNDEVVHEEVKVPPSLLPEGAQIRNMQEVYSVKNEDVHSGVKIYNGDNGICEIQYQMDPDTGHMIRTGTISSIDQSTGLRYDVKIVQEVDADGKVVSQDERMLSEDEAKDFRKGIQAVDKKYSEDGVNKEEKALYKSLKNAPTADPYDHGAHTIADTQNVDGSTTHIIQSKEGFVGEMTSDGKTVKFSIIQGADKEIHYTITDENGVQRPMTPQERLEYRQAIENTGDHDAAKMLKKFGKRDVYAETTQGQGAQDAVVQDVSGIVGELKGEGSTLQFQDGGADYNVGLTPQGLAVYNKVVDGQSVAMSDEEVHKINGDMLTRAKADLEAAPDDQAAAAKVALAQNIIASQGMEDHAVGELGLDQQSMKISLSDDNRAIVAVSDNGAALRVAGTTETQVIRVEGDQAKAYVYDSATKTETPMTADAQTKALQNMSRTYEAAGMTDSPAAKAINNTLSSQATNTNTAAPISRGGGYEIV